MQSLKDMDNVLDFRAEEALAALFQPDTVAPAEYLKIYERKPGLEPGKNLCSRCWKMPSAASKTLSVQRTTGRRNGFWKRRNGLTSEESEWIFSFENICDVLRT